MCFKKLWIICHIEISFNHSFIFNYSQLINIIQSSSKKCVNKTNISSKLQNHFLIQNHRKQMVWHFLAFYSSSPNDTFKIFIGRAALVFFSSFFSMIVGWLLCRKFLIFSMRTFLAISVYFSFFPILLPLADEFINRFMRKSICKHTVVHQFIAWKWKSTGTISDKLNHANENWVETELHCGTHTHTTRNVVWCL